MKLLRDIIFFKTLVLLVFIGNQAFALTNFSPYQDIRQQLDTAKKSPVKTKLNDTTKKTLVKTNPKDTAASEKVQYGARDSVVLDKESGVVYLYGKARVLYQDIELDADYITYNSKTNMIYARGTYDKKGKYIGRPIFKMTGQSTSMADSLKFNAKTKAGQIHGVFTEQEGGFFSGGIAKKQPDDEIHSKGQIYSTCNLPHPHFGLHITKGIVTKNQIITGPVYLEIEDIPLPLALPFAFFPKPNKKSSGVILPTPGEEATRGFFLQDGGYYFGLSDYWDAKVTGSVYSYGSYSARVASTYTKRYKYNGNVDLSYAYTKSGTQGTRDYQTAKDFRINWTHSQNANANPGTIFSASVNAGTSGYGKNTAGGDTYNQNLIANNILNSSISYGRTFSNGINLSTSFNHSQETRAKTVSLTLPNVSLSVPTFNPFDSKSRVGEQKWYQKITVGYTMQATNTINTADSLLFTKQSLSQFRTGIQHNVPINMSFNILKYFNFNTNVNYSEKWYFQSIRKTYGKLANGSDVTFIDTIPGFNRSNEYSVGGGLSTKVYSTAQFKNLGKLKAIRHVMTPSVSFSYKPDFSSLSKGIYKIAKYQNGETVYTKDYNTGELVPMKYSIQEQGVYGGPSIGRSATINFGIDNTVEAKIASLKDTTGTGERKIAIIQGLGINGSYDLLKKDFKLSDLSFSGRSQFTDKLGINYRGTLNPYLYEDIANDQGVVTRTLVDKYTWSKGQLPRLTNFGFSFDYSLNPESFKKKNEITDKLNEKKVGGGITPEQAEALAQISRDPNAFVDFNIPWNFSFQYSFDYRTDAVGQNSSITNNLSFSGDANVTPKWKVTFTSGWDFQRQTISMTNFAIYRDLHCWDMSFNWVPFGAYQSYSVIIKVKASVLQDLKLSKRKSYVPKF
ncbi:putative LPS assembly protein LptD [Pedobacter sp. MC2016-24]|uniref:putative LPS assembly protein LptD n=1 Tax=Pedobacter sp. MC2016-24 TaxID=2780090 RepID=UPI0018807C37|nr:putative LPS assembly protein LptD [Pedobacter sp. MC2016-24]MBE9598376.1 LPS-assembly protein LptD [Pedobacter sp. MC2016-24]